MVNWLATIAVIVLTTLAASMLFGLQFFGLTAILWGMLFAWVVHKARIFKIFPVNAKTANWIGVLLVGALFFMGGLAVLSPMLTPSAVMASLGGVTGISPAPAEARATLEGCRALATDELRGKTSSVTFNGYDLESDSPYAATAAATINVYRNGYHVNQTTTGGLSLSNIVVGDAINIYGNDSTYYVQPVEGRCMLQQADTIDVKLHMIATQYNLQVVCYDDTGATELSGPTASNQEDYDIVLGSDESKLFYCKYGVNSTNQALNLGGIAFITLNDIKECYPATGQGFTLQRVPKFLDATVYLTSTDSNTTNTTGGYEALYVLDTPVMLHEWDTVKYRFVIKAGSTNPATSNEPSQSDVCIMQFLDKSWSRGSDGNSNYDLYQHSYDEANVGFIEPFTRPGYKYSGVRIEGI